MFSESENNGQREEGGTDLNNKVTRVKEASLKRTKGVSRCKQFHLEGGSNEVLQNSTGNYIQSLGIDHDGREYEKIVFSGSLLCTGETGTTL